MKKYVLIAGVNGAGKSTLYQTLDSLKNMERVNSDEIVRGFGDWKNPEDVFRAGKMAVKKVAEYFRSGVSFNQETTLCGKAILRNIDKARALGYEIELHYIGIESADLAKQRIAYRVQRGGHDISNEDVDRRYLESFEHLKLVTDKCDTIILYDNTDVFKRFAVYQHGNLQLLTDAVPGWFEKYIM